MVRGPLPTTRYLPPRAIALTGVVVGIAARVSVCSLAEGGERGFVFGLYSACVRVFVRERAAVTPPLSLLWLWLCVCGEWMDGEVETDGLTD